MPTRAAQTSLGAYPISASCALAHGNGPKVPWVTRIRHVYDGV